jgi:hypothetical protein
MKKNRKFVQALVVVFIVGIGLFQNINRKAHIFQPLNPISISWDSKSVKADTVQSDENKLFIYTKKIISSGIYHLISNL